MDNQKSNKDMVAKKKWAWFQWAGPGLVVLLLDRLIKWIHLTVSEGQTVRNTGMAFGMFQGNSPVILVVSILLLAACFFLLRKTRPAASRPSPCP